MTVPVLAAMERVGHHRGVGTLLGQPGAGIRPLSLEIDGQSRHPIGF